MSHIDKILASLGKGMGRKFIGTIQKGNKLHQGYCRDPDESARLSQLEANGQEAEYGVIGTPSYNLDSLCKLGLATAFSITSPAGDILPISQPYDGSDGPRTIHAAVYYAAAVLGIKKFRLLLSDKDPILRYILGIDPVTGKTVQSTGVFMDLYRKYWDADLHALKEKDAFIRSPVKEKFRLAAIDLVQQSATRIDQMLRQYAESAAKPYDFSVVPYFYDGNDDRLARFSCADPTVKYTEDRIESDVMGDDERHSSPDYFACSCCDSRGLLRYALGAKLGQIYELDTIGAIVSDYHEASQSGHPSSTWLQIEVAEAEGCTDYAVVGHTKCGGIKELVKWCITGEEPANPHIKAYLVQAKPIVDELIQFARDEKMVDFQKMTSMILGDDKGINEGLETLCRWAEMHVARWSATNIRTKVGAKAEVKVNILAGILDIGKERNLYPLPLLNLAMPPRENILETFEMLKLKQQKELMTISDLYTVVAGPKRDRLEDTLKNKANKSLDPVVGG